MIVEVQPIAKAINKIIVVAFALFPNVFFGGKNFLLTIIFVPSQLFF